MRYIIFALLVMATPAFAYNAFAYNDRYSIEPQTYDVVPNDGFMDAGSMSNPYTVYTPSRNPIGTLEPRYPDIVPNDGFFDRGTSTNPYEIRWQK